MGGSQGTGGRAWEQKIWKIHLGRAVEESTDGFRLAPLGATDAFGTGK